MPRCSHCGRYVFGFHDVCPECSHPCGEAGHRAAEASAAERAVPSLADDDESGPDGPLVPIARFNNAAEAGYFAHELTEAGLAACVRIEETFDALSGYWGTRYLLCVPEPHSRPATVALQQLVEQTDCDEADEFAEAAAVPAMAARGHEFAHQGEYGCSPEAGTVASSDGGVNWVPIVLTLAAGSAAFWGAKKLHEPPKANAPLAPAGGQHLDLWDRLASPPRPWVQQHENGRGVRQLHIDSERGVAILREDADGDGVFEKEIEIRRPARGR